MYLKAGEKGEGSPCFTGCDISCAFHTCSLTKLCNPVRDAWLPCILLTLSHRHKMMDWLAASTPRNLTSACKQSHFASSSLYLRPTFHPSKIQRYSHLKKKSTTQFPINQNLGHCCLRLVKGSRMERSLPAVSTAGLDVPPRRMYTLTCTGFWRHPAETSCF